MISMPFSRRAAIVGLVLVTMAGCGSSDSEDSSSSSPSKTPLVGTHWLLNDSADLPTNGGSVTAEFVDGRVGGSSGCNTYNAAYVVEGKKLTIGPEIASTRMACEPGPTEVEAAYLERLPNVGEYKIDGTTLDLLDADGTTLLSYKAVDGAEAIVGQWEATSFYTGSSVTSVAVGSKLTAAFTGDEISGDGGCNTFGGGYKATKSTIKIGPLRSTLKACTDMKLQGQEQQYLAALELATSFRVKGDQLTLFRDDDVIAATFVRTAVAG